ncbi:hypothetical protein F7725_014462 [Dissostichus mawsoni]|uniref:Uncharacterized protein n=1 Tax=Dissostichus mawsoni TaxID=36200 RepID=A0A7J5YVZ7_DISMA|nr:hypothetical protein F7725_014462 [Dissostichus mawsoni]
MRTLVLHVQLRGFSSRPGFDSHWLRLTEPEGPLHSDWLLPWLLFTVDKETQEAIHWVSSLCSSSHPGSVIQPCSPSSSLIVPPLNGDVAEFT